MTKEEALGVIEKAEREVNLFSSSISNAPQEISEEKLEQSLDQILDELVMADNILIPDSVDWKRLQRIGARLKAIKRMWSLYKDSNKP